MDDRYILAPASQPQADFLASTSTITLYAGSAGAGKTFAIILNLVKFALMENSTIVCFRRTSTQLRQGGGIWQEACSVFRRMFGKDVVIRNRDLEIYLPRTNSSIKFSHLQYQSDVDNHLGSQYSVVVYDEAVLFPFEEMILPIGLGRLRNANVSYTPQLFLATNPKFDHGIYHWIKDFYLDKDGIPLPERSNVERYFVLENNKPIWFDSREDAEKIYGTGSDNGVRSFRSIRAHVTENKPLLRANPDYLSNLKSLPEIKRRIFLDGSWTAREEEAGYFKREWCPIVPFPNKEKCKRVRAWDTAATPVSSASPSPDWTRGTLISKDSKGIYTVEDIVSLRDRPHVVEQLIYSTAESDGAGVTVVLECDPGQAGIAYANQIKSKLAEKGFYCRVIKSNKAKLTRFLPVSALAEAGRISFVKSLWLEDALKELEEFNGERNNGHDDICDTLSTGVAALNQGTEMPTLSLSSIATVPMTAPNSTNLLSQFKFNGYKTNDIEIPRIITNFQ